MKKKTMICVVLLSFCTFYAGSGFDYWSLTNRAVIAEVWDQELFVPLPSNEEIDSWFEVATNSVREADNVRNVLHGLKRCMSYLSYPSQEVDRICSRCFSNALKFPDDYVSSCAGVDRGASKMILMCGALELPGMGVNPEVIGRVADYIGSIPSVSDAELAAANLRADSVKVHVATCGRHRIITHSTQPPLVMKRYVLEQCRKNWIKYVLLRSSVDWWPMSKEPEKYEVLATNVIDRARLTQEEVYEVFRRYW